MKVLPLLSLFLIISSCSSSLKYFTKDIQQESRWSESQLKKIQFYLSNDIILYRDITHGEAEISNGKIKMVDGRKVEEVIIKKGTKGAYLFSPEKNNFAIGFDANENDFLVFGPSAKVNGRYVLLAKEWGRNTGKISYGGKIFNTPASSAFAYLMVDMQMKSNTSVQSTKATGRDVN